MSAATPTFTQNDERNLCFACDRKHSKRQRWEYVITEDGAQTVLVGPTCYANVRKMDKRGGYQPPSGGPKLFLIGSKG